MLTQLNNLKDQLDILRGEFFNLFVCLFNFCLRTCSVFENCINFFSLSLSFLKILFEFNMLIFISPISQFQQNN